MHELVVPGQAFLPKSLPLVELGLRIRILLPGLSRLGEVETLFPGRLHAGIPYRFMSGSQYTRESSACQVFRTGLWGRQD